uniref:Large ribosomal subunit protein uL23c n=1 Tax=Euglenaformis proxima TaxID=299110 RepID=A0A023HHR7_9EUGL|nr:ribosomal protein L23 [Euglenaformis proxima]AGL12001.1 ribosomal protein L23 [Euglenaformis proxima]
MIFLDYVKSQIMTEKSNKLLKLNKYSFIVDLRLTKTDIKNTFKKIFNVEIKSINTCILSRKAHRLGKFKGFKNYYKKVLITLLDDNVIPFFSGL